MDGKNARPPKKPVDAWDMFARGKGWDWFTEAQMKGVLLNLIYLVGFESHQGVRFCLWSFSQGGWHCLMWCGVVQTVVVEPTQRVQAHAGRSDAPIRTNRSEYECTLNVLLYIKYHTGLYWMSYMHVTCTHMHLHVRDHSSWNRGKKTEKHPASLTVDMNAKHQWYPTVYVQSSEHW